MSYALGRRLQPDHDERSRAFPAAVAPLRTVMHDHFGPVLDQGNLGSCTGNAAAQALNCTPLRPAGRALLDEAAAVSIYSWATHHDPVPGVYPPTDTGSTGLAVAKAVRRLGLISGYSHAFGLQHTLQALVLAPVIIGVPWYRGFFTPTAEGYIEPYADVVGGHEVCLRGIDVENERVRVLNSWSASWADNGEAWMRWTVLGQLLAQDGDATVLRPAA